MSLQDILMQRAALHFQNELGPTSGGKPSELFNLVAANLEKTKKEKLFKEQQKQLAAEAAGNNISNSDKDVISSWEETITRNADGIYEKKGKQLNKGELLTRQNARMNIAKNKAELKKKETLDRVARREITPEQANEISPDISYNDILEASKESALYGDSGLNIGGQPQTEDEFRVTQRDPVTKIPTKEERVQTSEEIADEKYAAASDEITKEVIKGPSGEVAGRLELAKESIKSIQEIRSILFPKGTADSFDRVIATGSNIPGAQAPIIGGLIPDKLPALGIPGAKDLVSKSQKVHRLLGTSFAGRILIKSGVAVRPEELGQVVSRFAPGLFSDADNAFDALEQLEDFYANYLETADPLTRFPEQAEQIRKVGGKQNESVGELQAELDEINRRLAGGK